MANHGFRLRVRESATALTAVASLASTAHAQEWVRQLGTPGIESVSGIVPDGFGGTVILGSTEGDLGGTNAGGFDVYLARFNSAGDQLWIRQFGTSSIDYGDGLDADGAGGLLIIGSTAGVLGASSSGSGDVFVARYDMDGNRSWLNQMGSSGGEAAMSITPDGAGGMFICGTTKGDWGSPNAGGFDAFVARLDGAGQVIWLRLFGTGTIDIARDVISDGAGGALVVGDTRGDLAASNLGSTDAFLAKYDSNGNQVWIQQFGSRSSETGWSVTTDGAGGAYLAGKSGRDAAVWRYDDMGNQLWERRFTGGSPLGGETLMVVENDCNGGVVVSGVTAGSLGGPTAGGDDAFVSRFDSAGNRTWDFQFGSDAHDWGFAISCDSSSHLTIAGRTKGDIAGPNAGEWDMFVGKFKVPPCHADCDKSTGAGKLDVFDFLCFQNGFVNGDAFACDCDASTGVLVCDIFDFLCFQSAFVGGCP